LKILKTLEAKILLGIGLFVLAGTSFFAYDNWRYQSAKSLKKGVQENKDLQEQRRKTAESNALKEQKLIDNAILSKAADMCQRLVSLNLKNRSSYRNESKPISSFDGKVHPRSKIVVLLTYSATNSYGGRLDDTALCFLSQEGINKYLLYYVDGSKPAGFDENKSIYMVGLDD